jgi:D-xylose 1-dehydrogenase (NADP+, D-xylono-1,5-lactone-forming)
MNRLVAVRWGILSTARINLEVLIAPARASDRAEVVAVASRDQARAEKYAREHGIQRAYGSYEALLADPDIDAVYISLPNSLHMEWTIRALEAGKHVLCEKPVGRHPAEVERAFDVAERHGLVLTEAFLWRHHPQTKTLAELVRSGRIGEPRIVLARFTFPLEDPEDIRMRLELDGGALMDVGCYCVSAARLIGGDPVLAFGRRRVGPTGVDVSFLGTLEFPDRLLAHFTCGMDVPFSARLEVVGSEASAVVQDPWQCRDPHVQIGDERIDVEAADRFRLQHENMCGAIRGEAEPLLGRDEVIGQARTIDALYRSAESGSAVSL